MERSRAVTKLLWDHTTKKWFEISMACHIVIIIFIVITRCVRVTAPGTLVTETRGARCWPPSWAGSGPWWGWPALEWTAPDPTSRGCTPGESHYHYHCHYHCHHQGGQIPSLDPAKHVRNKTPGVNKSTAPPGSKQTQWSNEYFSVLASETSFNK